MMPMNHKSEQESTRESKERRLKKEQIRRREKEKRKKKRKSRSRGRIENYQRFKCLTEDKLNSGDSEQGNIRTGKCYASIKDRGERKERKQVFI